MVSLKLCTSCVTFGKLICVAGNGTQRAFNDDDTVLYISIHRYDDGTFYPCGPYGSLYSSGEGKGEGL
jgi:acetoin utilization deacetylase AcuC-like enzyme